MKPAARAILILSALLAVSVGWIIYSAVHGDAALKKAQTAVEAAQAENVTLKADNAALTASTAKQDALSKADKATIAEQGTLIATLKAQSGQGHTIAAAAVSEGADLETTYKAGAPVVEQIAVLSLTYWYVLMGVKIAPVLASVASFSDLIDAQNGTILSFATTVTTLTDSNTARQTAIDADKVTEAGMQGTIDSQALHLTTADTSIKTAEFRVHLFEGLTIGFAVTTGALLLYEGGHALKVW
jgi:hypothetical protein